MSQSLVLDAQDRASGTQGLGIAHAAEGDALWQNGQTFGFRNLMVIYPEYRMGVVVLSNSDHGFPAVFDVAQRALGGSAIPSMAA